MLDRSLHWQVRVRTDSVYVGSLPSPTWASLALVAGGVAGVVLRRTVWPAPRIGKTGSLPFVRPSEHVHET